MEKLKFFVVGAVNYFDLAWCGKFHGSRPWRIATRRRIAARDAAIRSRPPRLMMASLFEVERSSVD